MKWYTVLVKNNGEVYDTWTVRMPSKFDQGWLDRLQSDIDDIKEQFSNDEDWQYDALIQELEDQGYEFGDFQPMITVQV